MPNTLTIQFVDEEGNRSLTKFHTSTDDPTNAVALAEAFKDACSMKAQGLHLTEQEPIEPGVFTDGPYADAKARAVLRFSTKDANGDAVPGDIIEIGVPAPLESGITDEDMEVDYTQGGADPMDVLIDLILNAATIVRSVRGNKPDAFLGGKLTVRR